MKQAILLLVLFFIHGLTNAQGRLVTTTISATALENNLLGITTTQQIAVYLPPSYDTSSISYPVVYFLPGWTDRVQTWTGSYKRSMDKLIAGKVIQEFIVVVVDGYNFMGGNFYVNSPVTGNAEDFIVREVVGYIDANYRTLKNPASRGIAGHSMGGFGALNLAMLHPDVFGAVYSLSPGLFAKDGLTTCQLFKSQNFINQFIQKEQEYASMSDADALAAFKSYIQSRFNAGDYDTPFAYAYGSAFSPNPNKHFPFVDYPYAKQGDQVIVDSTKLQKYENGFGGQAHKITEYKENFLKLKLIGIDYGLNDEYRWIPKGCVYFAELLTAAGIPHRVETFNGGHGEQVTKRVEEYMLPAFSSSLVFDSTQTKVQFNNLLPLQFNLEQNYPNPFNPKTTIDYTLAAFSNVQLAVFDLLGRKVATLVDNDQEAGGYQVNFDGRYLASGIYFYKMNAAPILPGGQAANFIQTKKMLLGR